jgi:hypothetical protein
MAPPRPSPATAFVGRVRELSALTTALEEALSGRGRLVLIEGEPGMGKRRLAGARASTGRWAGTEGSSGPGTARAFGTWRTCSPRPTGRCTRSTSSPASAAPSPRRSSTSRAAGAIRSARPGPPRSGTPWWTTWRARLASAATSSDRCGPAPSAPTGRTPARRSTGAAQHPLVPPEGEGRRCGRESGRRRSAVALGAGASAGVASAGPAWVDLDHLLALRQRAVSTAARLTHPGPGWVSLDALLAQRLRARSGA